MDTSKVYVPRNAEAEEIAEAVSKVQRKGLQRLHAEAASEARTEFRVYWKMLVISIVAAVCSFALSYVLGPILPSFLGWVGAVIGVIFFVSLFGIGVGGLGSFMSGCRYLVQRDKAERFALEG